MTEAFDGLTLRQSSTSPDIKPARIMSFSIPSWLIVVRLDLYVNYLCLANARFDPSTALSIPFIKTMYRRGSRTDRMNMFSSLFHRK